jgi:hypothetical protein
MIAFGGFKGYMPAFWSLPNVFLVEAAAAGSIGLINSFGNLGGYLGPKVMGWVYNKTGSYDGSLWFLCCAMLVTAGCTIRAMQLAESSVKLQWAQGLLTTCVMLELNPTYRGIEGAVVETTTFLKPSFAISALPGTGVMQVQVKAVQAKAVPARNVVDRRRVVLQVVPSTRLA